MNLMQQIKTASQSRWYWLIYIVGGLFMLSDALYFQHVLEELPCVVCIQIRLWVTLLIIVSIAGLLFRRNKIANSVANLSIVLIAIGMVERSYLLLGTERGFVFSDCGFNLGLPTWFAVEEWLPWMYRIETSCGYTPEIIFGITMAEALMMTSVLLLLVSASVFVVNLISLKR